MTTQTCPVCGSRGCSCFSGERAKTLTETPERVEMGEDELEAKLSHSHYGGRASAFEEVTRALIASAGNLFSAGDDKLAKYLRDTLAPRFEERGVAARKTQKEHAS